MLSPRNEVEKEKLRRVCAHAFLEDRKKNYRYYSLLYFPGAISIQICILGGCKYFVFCLVFINKFRELCIRFG